MKMTYNTHKSKLPTVTPSCGIKSTQAFIIKERRNHTMKKALVVGLNNYPSCNLHWCDNDAIAIASLMEANGDGF